jgi:hypothetical protein
MRRPHPDVLQLLVLPVVLLSAAGLWLLHAQAWDLGGRSPILNYDTAQYALAGRELAWHGHLATPYALPVELATHASPPWPLAVVQPGLVLFEAAVFRLLPARGAFALSDSRAWLTLMLPFGSFLLLAAGLSLSVRHLFTRWWPDSPFTVRVGAMLTLGLAFALDPEAQHFAIGGFTELPFTVGLLFAFLGLALEAPARIPLAYGVVLGLAGLFRANMLWLAPLFAAGAAWSAPPGRRVRTCVLVLVGFALPLSPWWFYKWRQFGSPAWDLTKLVVWDGVQGQSWNSLFTQTAAPPLPTGTEAFVLLAGKAGRNLPGLLVQSMLGPRGLWIGGLAAWLAFARPPRPLAAAGIVALAAAALGALTAALSIPWLRYLFPTRILLEPIGMLALGALLWRLPDATLPARARRYALAGIAVIALGWGGWCAWRGTTEAYATSFTRAVPSTSTLTEISIMLSHQLASGEPLMSNLGPALAWQTNHPVVHLAFSPEDVAPIRRRLDFRHIVIVRRGDGHVGPGWDEIVEHQGAAAVVPGLHVIRERHFRSEDDFVVVWLELGPQTPAVAEALPPARGAFAR